MYGYRMFSLSDLFWALKRERDRIDGHRHRSDLCIKSILIAIGFLLVSLAGSQADTVTLYPTDDAYIYSQPSPGGGNGGNTYLKVGHSNDNGYYRTLLKFSLASIPAGSTINSATLYLYYYVHYGSTSSKTIYAYRADGSWGESTVNWSNRPLYSGHYDGKSIGGGSYGWKYWTVTTLVQYWINGTYSNDGIILRWSPEDITDNRPYFYAKENGPYRPYLSVAFTPPAQDLQLVQSSCYVSPSSQNVGGQVTVYYRIYNPNSFSVTTTMGCSIRPASGGDWVDDEPHDKTVSAPSGYSTQYRYFDLRASEVCPGLYTVAYAIKDGPITGPNFDIFERDDLTIILPAPTLYNISPNPSYTGNYTVSWSSVTGVDSYQLQWDTNSSFSSPDGTLTAYSTSYGVIEQTLGTHYYRVRAKKCSSYSVWSNTRSVLAELAAPSNVQATGVSESQIQITWTDNSSGVNNEDGFYILESTDSSNWFNIDSVGTNVTSYTRGGLPPGTTRYYAIKAYKGGSWQSDFSNIDSGTTWAFPDLVISYLSPDSVQAIRGEPFSITTKVKNQGDDPAQASILGIYVSTNPAFHGSLIAERAVGSLAVGSESSAITHNIIADFDDAMIYVFTRANEGNAVDEGSYEDNNWSDDTLTPGYVEVSIGDPPYHDLQVASVDVDDDTPVPGQTVNVSYTVTDQGNETTSTGIFVNSVLWSMDSTITLSDDELETDNMAGMVGGESQPGSVQVTVPGEAQPGITYYIGIYADSENIVNETDGQTSYEGNNTGYRTITVEVPILYVSPTDIDLGSHLAGYSFSDDFIVKNNGGGTLNGNVSESAPWITSLSPTSFSRTANQQTTINFSGSFPSTPGPFNTNISVISNAGDQNVYVHGNVEEPLSLGEQFIAEAVRVLEELDAKSITQGYDSGIKHLIFFSYDVNPLPFFTGNVTLILDLDDMAQITQEGQQDWVTYWLDIQIGLSLGTTDFLEFPNDINAGFVPIRREPNIDDPKRRGQVEFLAGGIAGGKWSLIIVDEQGIQQGSLNWAPDLNFASFTLLETSWNLLKGEISRDLLLSVISSGFSSMPLGTITNFTNLATSIILDLYDINAEAAQSELPSEFLHLHRSFTSSDSPGAESPNSLTIRDADGGVDVTGDPWLDNYVPDSPPVSGKPSVYYPLKVAILTDDYQEKNYKVVVSDVPAGWDIEALDADDNPAGLTYGPFAGAPNKKLRTVWHIGSVSGSQEEISVTFKFYEYKVILPDELLDTVSVRFSSNLPPDIAVSPPSDNYNNVVVGNYLDKTFTVSNPGTALVNVTSVSLVSGVDFSIQSGGGSFSLNPGATHPIVVRFSPSSVGSKSDTLRLVNNVPGKNPLDVSLQGTGIDDTPPPAPVISSSTHAEGVWSNNDDPNFSWTEPTDTSGIAGYSYAFDNSPSTVPDTTSEGTGTSKSYIDVTDGIWYFHVRARDGAGTWGSAGHSGPVKIDTEPPPAPDISSIAHAEDVWSNSDAPVLNWTEPIDASGIEGYSYEFDHFSDTLPDEVSEGTDSSKSYSNVTDGVWYLHVRAQDGAGNWGNADHYGPVKIDDTPPSAPTISSTTHTEGVWSNNDDPFFSWIAPSDMSGVGGYSYEFDSLPTTIPDTTPEGTGTSKSYSGVADGVWYFHVRAEDGAGNWGSTDHYGSVKIGTPDITVTPSPGDYGIVPVGSYYDETFTVSNPGSAPLSVTATNLTGSADFLFQSGDGSFGLSPGETHDTVVRFAPSSAGSETATLSLTNNVPDESLFDVVLCGTGTVPETLMVQALCPVDLEVTDPQDRSISRIASAIPLASYTELDINGDGDLDDEIIIPGPLAGNYSIQVIPDGNAQPTDCYTLDVIYNGGRNRLADNEEIQDCPSEPYSYEVSQEFSCDLREGWNLISLPAEPDDTRIQSVLRSIQDICGSVWAYDPNQGWLCYFPDALDISNLWETEFGLGYWVQVRASCSLEFEGNPTAKDINLSAGWNLVGCNSPASQPIGSATASISEKCNCIWTYDSQKKQWLGYNINGPSFLNKLNEMKLGMGYWMNMKQNTQWTSSP